MHATVADLPGIRCPVYLPSRRDARLRSAPLAPVHPGHLLRRVRCQPLSHVGHFRPTARRPIASMCRSRSLMVELIIATYLTQLLLPISLSPLDVFAARRRNQKASWSCRTAWDPSLATWSGCLTRYGSCLPLTAAVSARRLGLAMTRTLEPRRNRIEDEAS